MSGAASEAWKSQFPPLENLECLKLERPLVVFDLETTGINRNKDRIVEFGAIKVFPNGRTRSFRWLINPNTPIPPHASKVHKIRDEDVIQYDTFSQKAKGILEIFHDSDMLGFNNISFDRPFLQSEFQRLADRTGKRWVFPPEGTREIDAMRIYHSREKHKGVGPNEGGPQASESTSSWSMGTAGGGTVEDTADSGHTSQYGVDPIYNQPIASAPVKKKPKMNLTQALKFYCDLDLRNAHTALADADATLRVLIGQLDMYEDLPTDVQSLHNLCLSKRAQSANKRNQDRPVSAQIEEAQIRQLELAMDDLQAQLLNLQVNGNSNAQLSKGSHSKNAFSSRAQPLEGQSHEGGQAPRTGQKSQKSRNRKSITNQSEFKGQNQGSRSRRQSQVNERPTQHSDNEDRYGGNETSHSQHHEATRPSNATNYYSPERNNYRVHESNNGQYEDEYTQEKYSHCYSSRFPPAHNTYEQGENSGGSENDRPYSENAAQNYSPNIESLYNPNVLEGYSNHEGPQYSNDGYWAEEGEVSDQHYQGLNPVSENYAGDCHSNHYSSQNPSQSTNGQHQRIYIRWENTEPVFAFGRYKGASVEYVAVNDCSYLHWMQNQDFPRSVLNLIDSYVADICPQRTEHYAY